MDCDIASYHIQSFNYLADEGVNAAALDVPAEKFRLPNGDAVELRYTSAQLGYPSLETNASKLVIDSMKLYPSECRQRGITYRGPLKVGLEVKVNGIRIDCCEITIGEVPIMLRSSRCHLQWMSKKQLVEHGEELSEFGGYFICKGSEKIMRLLIGNRRNFPIAIMRRTFREKGALFSPYGVMMRCIRGNHSAALITLHYLESGGITVALQFRREIFYLPLMYVIKSLVNMTDVCIKEHMVKLRPGDHFWEGCVTSMLALCNEDGIMDQKSALEAIGSRFRVVAEDRVGPWETHIDIGRFLLRACVAIHLDSDDEKFFLLAYMAQKLIAFVKGECTSESPDNPQFQEATVSGHVLLMIIRERMENLLGIARRKIEFEIQRKPDSYVFTSHDVARAIGTQRSGEITRGLEYFLATGNLLTKNGLGLQQNNGFSVIAERINYLRFVSHFRAIHRGAFFMEMRTTDVRKLRPEAWGFICPVHTPDGAPCGLLNHLTASVRIVTHYSDTKQVPKLLGEMGMIGHRTAHVLTKDLMLPVLFDGKFIGYIPYSKAAFIERQLRFLKVANDPRMPYSIEIVLIRPSIDPVNIITQYAGLYLFADPARFIRPVKYLPTNRTEFIGTFEQVYLSICIDPEEAEPDVTIHQELHPSCLFSYSANLIPFPDHNQSPRNVYQCQMAKQTMGTPVHAWDFRADNKMYRIQFPQNPIVKPEPYKRYGVEDYPLGTNACVAVISYTGYDMEDAMVINKSSFQRGFGHGTVIKVERFNLSDGVRNCTQVFLADPSKPHPTFGDDGLPTPGRLYLDGDYYCSVYDIDTATYKLHKYKHAEPAFCGSVRIIEDSEASNLTKGKCHALIQWRIQRNPIIGDKFASRHGQKGINSFLWPVESLPFTESGMVPDIIFNPHGFPSRMTIGMMIESMAGKAAAMNGTTYDSSPFVFNDKKTAIDHFGQILTAAGYNYYGNETMYSGVDGREMEVQIFYGIVYYQRLRHMVADKFQVRSTGPSDPVTLQPVKGRKKGGGIRFGEMERDAMIAHGTSFTLQDRLFNCSDRDIVNACARCNSIVSTLRCAKNSAYQNKLSVSDHSERIICSLCNKDDEIFAVEMPRVFSYLAAELASLNVRLNLTLDNRKPLKVNQQ